VPPPLLGKRLTLVAGEGGGFVLRDPQGAALLEGTVGAVASGGGVSAFVSELVATPGTRFDVAVRSVDDATEALQAELKVSEKGRKTGILRLALEGDSPQRIARTLDAIAGAYVRQNVERKSAEAEKTLEFLESQLPTLRADLGAAEAELERYRKKAGSVDVGLEAQAAVSRTVEIEKGATELKLELATLRRKFTDEHPAVAAVRDRIGRLEAEKGALEGRIKALPTSELESARRLRDAKVANELYITVLNKAQELKVVKEGTVGNVRIIDAAIVPRKPVSPRRLATLAVALAVGLLGGIAAAFARRALDRGLEDP
jgi:tyrosine-protein kinase Etk/Wzc